MHLQFNNQYVANSDYSIAMIVANAVQGDSRVLKTAATLSKLGFRVNLYGVSKTDHAETLEGYPFVVELTANPVYRMKEEGVWHDEQGRRNIPLFIDYVARNMAECMGATHFDVLHTHDMYGLPVGAAIKKQMFPQGIAWIHDMHEYVEGCTNIDEHVRATLWQLEKEHIREPDVLTTVSPILARMIVQRYGVSEPRLILNAPRLVDYDPWYPRPVRVALGLGKDVPLMVYNGNVKPIRGVHFAVEALPYIPDMCLILITNSRGQYVNDLLEKADQLGVADRLRIHPYVPNEEVTSFLQDVNVGVNPVSLYANSDLALPNKIFEYIHSGTPIVSTATQALTKFLESNHCGMTFPEGDVKALADAVKTTMSRYPSGLASVAKGSKIAAEYCWETQEPILEQAYKTLLDRHNPVPHKGGRHEISPIVHLPRPSANQPFTLAETMRKCDVDAACANIVEGGYGYKHHHTLVRQKHNMAAIESYLVEQNLMHYMTYHFHARPLIYRGDFSFPTGVDLILLKAMNKSVFFHFRGSEIRRASLFAKLSLFNYVQEQQAQSTEGMPYPFDEDGQKAFRDFICGVSDGVFVNDPELQCYVPNAIIVPRAVDDNNFCAPKENPTNNIPVIVHAPSRRGVKGTEYVLSAVKQLKREGYSFEFKLVENVSHNEAMEIYRTSDIIVDQLRIGWYGVLAVEGMALGKAVVTYIRRDLRHYLPYPPPLAIADPETIVDLLRSLLKDPDRTARYAEAGYRFVREYHSATSISRQLMEIYRRSFRPVDPLAVSRFFDYQAGLQGGIGALLSPIFYYPREFKRAIKNKGIWYAMRKVVEVVTGR